MATHTYAEPRRLDIRHARSVAQVVTVLFSLAFVVVGVAGFIPSLTTHSAQLTTTGPDSHALLFDLFQTSVLHNIVHIAFGVVGLLAANGPRMSRLFLVLGGVAYLGLTAWGFLVDMASNDNVLPVNTNDNWLHLGLGASMLILGILARRRNPEREAVETTD